jgi:lipopolysaccharide export system protein LptA
MRHPHLAGILALCLAASVATIPASWAATEAPKGDQPVEILADQFEVHQDQNAGVARGNVVATQGDLALHSDTLTVLYRKESGGSPHIYRLLADGNVTLQSPDQKAFGDHGVYDIDKSVAVLTGDKLRMETKQDVVTARESLEYWREQNLLVARGDALAVRNDKRIAADQLIGLMEENPDKQLDLTRIDAKGNVVITTPSEVARGSQGIYDVGRKIATLTGDVKVTRGQSQLNGSAAEVNMDTGISRMLAGPKGQGSGRVRGLFVPNDKTVSNKPSDNKPNDSKSGDGKSGGTKTPNTAPGGKPAGATEKKQ